MRGVLRYFSKVSGSGVDLTLLEKDLGLLVASSVDSGQREREQEKCIAGHRGEAMQHKPGMRLHQRSKQALKGDDMHRL